MIEIYILKNRNKYVAKWNSDIKVSNEKNWIQRFSMHIRDNVILIEC